MPQMALKRSFVVPGCVFDLGKNQEKNVTDYCHTVLLAC